MTPTHILFLMSDTGGGHRAACRAMEAALNTRFPGRYTFEMVDMWKDYMPPPFNNMPTTYTKWVNNSPKTYAAQFWVNDRLFRLRAFSALYCRTLFGRMHRLYRDHPADMIICAHSVFVRPSIYAHRRLGLTTPFLTVVTDYAWPTVLWYDSRVNRTLVPTEPSFQRGLKVGLSPDKMVITGAPVHPKFTGLAISKAEARNQLGWPQDAQIALMVGGGDGMGPLVATAQAIDSQSLPPNAEMSIIAGRNQAMKQSLEALQWRHTTRIYGFVDNIQVFMRGADLLITKAGPATITEAATVGVPMIISGAIPFQESPNVAYVIKHNAGVYAPGPRRVAESVATLFGSQRETLANLAKGVQNLAEPDAIWKIAAEIAAQTPA